jgi:hypothetical protein
VIAGGCDEVFERKTVSCGGIEKEKRKNKWVTKGKAMKHKTEGKKKKL